MKPVESIMALTYMPFNNDFTLTRMPCRQYLTSIRLANFAEKIGYNWAWISPSVPRCGTDEEG